jgi:CRP-like cAMP-binding protein
MTVAEILDLFHEVPGTEHLSEPLLERLAAISTQATYKPKQKVVSHDEPPRAIHVILKGTVLLELPRHGDRVAHQLHHGLSFGEVPVLNRHPTYGYDATATEYGTEVIDIAAEPFRELFQTDPELPSVMCGSLSEKVTLLAGRVEELSITCATTRLARHLLSRPSREVSDGVEIDLGVDRKDLAAILAITPEHLSRLLKRWADAEVLRPMGRTLALLRPDLLRAMADLEDDPA